MTTMRRIRAALRGACATATIVALAACGTAPPDAAGSGGPGWRKGLVVRVGDRESLGPPIDSDCRERTHGGDAAQRYVEVQYFVGRHAHLRIVPIDDARDVVAGDPVWFRSLGCAPARLAGPPGG